LSPAAKLPPSLALAGARDRDTESAVAIDRAGENPLFVAA
jgi:hypothetical protein